MPKPNIVFRESLEDDQSDGEIEIIPYTKPTPMVIDLLDSGSDNDNGASKKSPKKKAKKKKRKKDKERGQGGSTNVASLDDLSQVSSMVRSLNVVPDNNNACDEEINSGQAVEPATSAEVDCGSENVVAESNLSSTGSSSDTQLPLNPLHTEAESETPLPQNNDRSKRVRNPSEKKSNKAEGKSRVRTTSSATHRTNVEMANFMTTLGIPMEPNAFETPVTRKKQPRKRPSQVPTAVPSLDSSATNSNDGQNLPASIAETTVSASAFVSVTQDIVSSASQRDLDTPNGRRQSGDVSDYTASFTNKELNAINNASFHSNILIGETENRLENTRDGCISVLSSDTPKQKSWSHTKKPNYYSEVIGAVARSLEPSMLFSPNLESDDKHSKNNNQHLSAQHTTAINETNSEAMIESMNSRNNNENGSHVQTIVNCDQEATTTEDRIVSVHNHVEQTNVAANASNNSDNGNSMDHNQLNKTSQKTTSTPITVAKEVVASEVVCGANSNVVKVNKSATSSADKSPPPVVTGVEKLPQTPKEGNALNENFNRDVQCKRKFSDDNEPSAASVSLRTNKNSGEAGIIKVIANKEISDSDRASSERKRRRINNNITPASSKTHNDNDDIRERTSEKEGRRVHNGDTTSTSSGSSHTISFGNDDHVTYDDKSRPHSSKNLPTSDFSSHFVVKGNSSGAVSSEHVCMQVTSIPSIIVSECPYNDPTPPTITSSSKLLTPPLNESPMISARPTTSPPSLLKSSAEILSPLLLNPSVGSRPSSYTSPFPARRSNSLQHPFMNASGRMFDTCSRSNLLSFPDSPMDFGYQPVSPFCLRKNTMGEYEADTDNDGNCTDSADSNDGDYETILKICGQRSPIPVDLIFNGVKDIEKIGEGVYGEVYSGSFRYFSQCSWVYKVVAIAGDAMVNGEKQKGFSEVLPEIIVSQELSKLKGVLNNCYTDGFAFMKNARIAKGKYPAILLEPWEKFHEKYESDNDKPNFGQDQLYMVLEFEFAGQDVESLSFRDARQTLSIVLQVAHILAVGEFALDFEHRDLHWGNILVRNWHAQSVRYLVNGETFHVPSVGIKAAVIDFTISRVKQSKSHVVTFLDLRDDEEQFLGTGDHQFDIYRMMRDHNRNNWQAFCPKTNIFWLHYLANKLYVKGQYTSTSSSANGTFAHHVQAIRILREFSHSILEYKSALNFVKSAKCRMYREFLELSPVSRDDTTAPNTAETSNS